MILLGIISDSAQAGRHFFRGRRDVRTIASGAVSVRARPSIVFPSRWLTSISSSRAALGTIRYNPHFIRYAGVTMLTLIIHIVLTPAFLCISHQWRGESRVGPAFSPTDGWALREFFALWNLCLPIWFKVVLTNARNVKEIGLAEDDIKTLFRSRLRSGRIHTDDPRHPSERSGIKLRLIAQSE